VLESATTLIFGTTSSSDAEAGAEADNIRIAPGSIEVDNLSSGQPTVSRLAILFGNRFVLSTRWRHDT